MIELEKNPTVLKRPIMVMMSTIVCKWVTMAEDISISFHVERMPVFLRSAIAAMMIKKA